MSLEAIHLCDFCRVADITSEGVKYSKNILFHYLDICIQINEVCKLSYLQYECKSASQILCLAIKKPSRIVRLFGYFVWFGPRWC